MPTAIVTGADSGIGKATAVALVTRGFDVGITWFEDQPGAESSLRELADRGVRAAACQLDLSDAGNGPRAVAELADALGGLDVLVNNAGIGGSAPFLDMTLDQWRRVLEVDLFGAFTVGQAAARHMVRAGRAGRIINITSVHEFAPLPQAAAYCAAKGGLGMLTKVMALELAAHGITVNAVAPGEVATPMTGAHDRDPHEIRRPGIPAGRPGSAQEIAAAVAFLASGDATYVTGTSLVVDGGMLLTPALHNLEQA
jgi:NAD(P)-dependent dehydrogenase (short-subunit alcohol dehydrogenase family)